MATGGGVIIACHPTLQFVAITIGGKDDAVLLYDLVHSGWSLPRLSHASQHQISCAQWEPLDPTSLAVGCAGGVCLWTLHYAHDAPAVGGAPTVAGVHLARFLAHPHGAPVSSIAWSPFGGQLASASRDHAAVCVWEACSGESASLSFGSARGIAALSWAPSGLFLAAVGVGGPVRLWEAVSWTWETLRFAAADAYAEAAWSGDGSTLLLLPARGVHVRAVHVRPAAPPIRLVDGGAHALPIRTGPAQQPALLLRPRVPADDGGSLAADALAAVERVARAAAVGSALDFDALPEAPGGYMAVARFGDARARARALAALANGSACVECSARAATSSLSLSHAAWATGSNRLALCVREELEVDEAERVDGAASEAPLVVRRHVHIFETQLDPVLQLTVLGSIEAMPQGADRVRVCAGQEASPAHAAVDGAGPLAGPCNVGFVQGAARASGAQRTAPMLALAWETGELALTPSV